MAVYCTGRKVRPNTGSCNAMIEAGDRPYARPLQLPDHRSKVMGTDLNIAVGDDQNIVLCQRHHVGEVGDLAVGAILLGTNLQYDRLLRKGSLQALDYLFCSVRVILRSEYHLDWPVVTLSAERRQSSEQV